MKKKLKTFAILLISIGVVALLLALFWHFAAYNVQDGTAGMYHFHIRLMWIHLIIGILAVAVSIICLVLRSRL